MVHHAARGGFVGLARPRSRRAGRFDYWDSTVDKIKIYSPTQIAVSSFCGGPFAAVFTLWKNFRSLENASGAMQTLVWGSLFVVVLFVVVPYLPDKFPNVAIPLAYALTARFIAQQHQMTKQAILESDRYAFQSNWNVFGISIGFMIAFLVAFVMWILALERLGLLKLD
jgi:hypothetical protein